MHTRTPICYKRYSGIDTKSHSKIERGDDEEPTQAYYQHVEDCDEEGNKAI